MNRRLYVLIEQTKYEPIFVNVFTDLEKALECAKNRYEWEDDDIEAFKRAREYNLGNGFSVHIGTVKLNDASDNDYWGDGI